VRNESRGKKARPITGIRSTALGKRRNVGMPVKLFRIKSHKAGAM
jgi:hypothetical protein